MKKHPAPLDTLTALQDEALMQLADEVCSAERAYEAQRIGADVLLRAFDDLRLENREPTRDALQLQLQEALYATNLARANLVQRRADAFPLLFGLDAPEPE